MNISEVRKSLTRHVTTFGNQRGIKIVKYRPLVHDPLIDSTWCRNFVSAEKWNEILDVYRERNRVPRVGDLVSRVGLMIYVATTMRAGKLAVVGLVAWAKYYKTDYLYGDINVLKRGALRSRLVSDSDKKILRNRNTPMWKVKDILEGDNDTPHFEVKEEEKWKSINTNDTGDLLILCVDPASSSKSVGRLLFAHFYNQASRKYGNLIINLGKANQGNRHTYNNAMMSLSRKFKFNKAKALFSHQTFGIENVEFKGENGEKETFLARSSVTSETTLRLMKRLLDLSHKPLGTVTCSRVFHTGHAMNGSRYATEDEWEEKCKGRNVGYRNPYASNYMRM
jgi:hypothetical protein